MTVTHSVVIPHQSIPVGLVALLGRKVCGEPLEPFLDRHRHRVQRRTQAVDGVFLARERSESGEDEEEKDD
jgi:hypothetical protein